jgi:hypothetical protein
VDLKKKKGRKLHRSVAARGAFSGFEIFLEEIRLDETNRGCLSKDKRSSLEAAAEIRTGGFAGDR